MAGMGGGEEGRLAVGWPVPSAPAVLTSQALGILGSAVNGQGALPKTGLGKVWLQMSLWLVWLTSSEMGPQRPPQISGLGCSGLSQALARSQLPHPGPHHWPHSAAIWVILTTQVLMGGQSTPLQEPPAEAGRGAPKLCPLGPCRREGLWSLGVSCVLSQKAQGRRRPGSVRYSSGAARWAPRPSVSPSSDLLPPGWSGASQHGATGALGPFCPLGSRVPRPAPLAVGAVHSLPQEGGAEAAGQASGLGDAGRGVTAETTPPLLPQQVRYQAA